MKTAVRNGVIFELAIAGTKYTDIGNHYGICKERVRQIVYKELKKRGFQFSKRPGFHDIQRARRLYENGGLRTNVREKTRDSEQSDYEILVDRMKHVQRGDGTLVRHIKNAIIVLSPKSRERLDWPWVY